MTEPQPVQRPDACLFCGDPLSEETRTEEHVFPLWLQNRHGLLDQELVLLNGTSVRYRQLKVPACQDCNNVHASQLEQRVLNGTASEQDIWIWMLKLMLGTMYFETGVPWERDQRHPASRHSIVDGDDVDREFFYALFDTVKQANPQFAPNPLGSVFEFETSENRFHYADHFYRHPHGSEDHNYAAACLCAIGRCWITIFDDEGNVARNCDLEHMKQLVANGRDPVCFLPELMYTRARYDYMPQPTVFYEEDRAAGVMFVPPLGQVQTLPHDPAVLDMFRRVTHGMASR